MGARTNAKATRARALLNGARTNLISRTARVYSRLGRSLSKELNGVVQEWISAVLRESESDIASGLLSGLPAMPNDFERVARETMVRALAQGYWLQHVYMQECRAAAHGYKYRGRVTLADGAELDDEEIRRLLELLLKSARVEADPAWHSVIPVDAVKWIEGYTPKLVGILERDILEKVRQTVRDSMLAGTTLKQRMEALREAEPRIRALGKHRAEMIARTEVTRADSMGRLIDMKSNPDVLGVEFSAVLDDRTTDMCQSRHGLVMRMDDPRLPYNTPPLHPQCRSLLLPATVYEHPDGLLTSHEFDEIEPGIQRPEDIEAVREVLGSIEEIKPPKAAAEETIRGVRKSIIDSLRGERAHAKKAHEWNAATVKADYARVGISITDEEAKEIYSAIDDFSGPGFSMMRMAFVKNRNGETLNPLEQKALSRFNLIEEYAKVAPIHKNTANALYRGITNHGGRYAKNLLDLKTGDIFDLEMSSSFSSKEEIARKFAGYRGIILRIEDASWHEAPSISGFSQFFSEKEALVSDKFWRILRVFDDATGCRNIVVTRELKGG